MKKIFPSILFIALLGILLAACQEQQEITFPNQPVPQQILTQATTWQQGRKLFIRHCLECHGTLAEGRNRRAAHFTPPAPDFLNPSYAAADPAYLFWRISKGKMAEPFFSRGSVMPAFGPHLDKPQIWQLVAYIRQRSQGKK